jgi:hypothetical protein
MIQIVSLTIASSGTSNGRGVRNYEMRPTRRSVRLGAAESNSAKLSDKSH